MASIIRQLSGAQYGDEKRATLDFADEFVCIRGAGTLTLDKSKRGDKIGEADAGGYTLIGRFCVEAGTEYMIGLRAHMKGGLFYVQFKDSEDAIIHGQALLKACNTPRTITRTIAGVHTRELDYTDLFNRQTQPLLTAGLNIDTVWVTPDAWIELFFKPETDLSVIDGTKDNKALVDVTVRWL